MRSYGVLFAALALVVSALVLLAVCQPFSVGEESLPAANDEKAAFVTGRAAIARALDGRVQVEAENATLPQVLAMLERQTHVQMLMDERSLRAAELEIGEPHRFRLGEVTAREALDYILGQLRMGYVIRGPYVLVTTTKMADATWETACYDVTDLLMCQDRHGRLYSTDGHALADVIRQTIAADTWNTVGGAGTLTAVDLPAGSMLVCTQTQRTHHVIADFIRAFPKAVADHGVAGNAGTLKPQDPKALVCPPDEALTGSANRSRSDIWSAASHWNNETGCSQYRYLSGCRDQGQYQTPRQDENLLVSPIAATTAAGLLYLSARDQTAAGLGMALQQAMLATAARGRDGGNTPVDVAVHEWINRFWLWRNIDACDLSLSTRLWRKVGRDIRPAFEMRFGTLCGVSTGFDAHDPAVPARLQAWASESLGRPIDSPLPEIPVRDVEAVLSTTAIGFRGVWEQPFARAHTRLAEFDRERKRRLVKMMETVEPLRFAALDGVTMIERRFAGGVLSLLVLLPDDHRGALAALERRLNAGNIDAWDKAMELRTVHLRLPRFQMESFDTSRSGVEASSLDRVFRPEVANRALVGEDGRYHVQEVIQIARLELDEDGGVPPLRQSTAPAVLPPDKPGTERFTADRPFLFIVRDVASKIILFVGRCAKPVSGHDEPLAPAPPPSGKRDRPQEHGGGWLRDDMRFYRGGGGFF